MHAPASIFNQAIYGFTILIVGILVLQFREFVAEYIERHQRMCFRVYAPISEYKFILTVCGIVAVVWGTYNIARSLAMFVASS